MALIKIGSINNFAVSANETAIRHKPYLKRIRNFSALNEVSRDIAPNTFDIVTSTDQRGIGLKSITLKNGFEGFLQKFLNPTNEIYFVSWVWDLSGQPIIQYPGSKINARDVIIPIKIGAIREFIGQGINLFPKRQVKGGIAIRIQLWESDEKERNFGKAMIDTADAIKKSELNNLLSLVSLTTGVTEASITLIKESSIGLAKIIGTILQSNGNDYVDFFEGYYSADQNWIAGDETYEGNASILTFKKY